MIILYALVFCLHVYLWESVGSSGTRVLNGCELLHGSWELNLGPLGKQSVILTAEPSLQPQLFRVLSQSFPLQQTLTGTLGASV